MLFQTYKAFSFIFKTQVKVLEAQLYFLDTREQRKHIFYNLFITFLKCQNFEIWNLLKIIESLRGWVNYEKNIK